MDREEASNLVASLPDRHLVNLGDTGGMFLAGILAGRWIWSRVVDLPGRWITARDLKSLGWVDLWLIDEEGLHATLTLKAARRLGVVVDELPKVQWQTNYEDVDETITEWVDVATLDAAEYPGLPESGYVEVDREVTRRVGTSIDVLSILDRWVSVDTFRNRRGYLMPRTRGMSSLPFPDRLPSPPVEPFEPEPEPAPAPAPAITPAERREILGALVGPLRRGKPARRGKSRNGKPGR